MSELLEENDVTPLIGFSRNLVERRHREVKGAAEGKDSGLVPGEGAKAASIGFDALNSGSAALGDGGGDGEGSEGNEFTKITFEHLCSHHPPVRRTPFSSLD